MGNENLQFTAWMINCTKFSITNIVLTGARCIKITIKLCCMTEQCSLIEILAFTTSEISCLTGITLSLKLSGTKGCCQRKCASWKNMFYKTLFTSVCVCAALLFGNTSTHILHSVVNKTGKSYTYTCMLCPVFLKYKVNLTMNITS